MIFPENHRPPIDRPTNRSCSLMNPISRPCFDLIVELIIAGLFLCFSLLLMIQALRNRTPEARFRQIVATIFLRCLSLIILGEILFEWQYYSHLVEKYIDQTTSNYLEAPLHRISQVYLSIGLVVLLMTTGFCYFSKQK